MEVRGTVSKKRIRLKDFLLQPKKRRLAPIKKSTPEASKAYWMGVLGVKEKAK